MQPHRVIVVGGGAAGIFAAIRCADRSPGTQITVLEKTAHCLAKVRISGGGRCNVTHACFDPRELATRYPRGGQALIGAFHRFQPRDTIAWFEARGVHLKTEADGRMFPVSDSSATIIDCLVNAARRAGVQCRTGSGVSQAERLPSGGFRLRLDTGEDMAGDRLLLATGGCRTATAGQLAVGLGHSLEAPVPSLFSLESTAPWLTALAGVAVEDTELSVPHTPLRQRGPLLITHRGISGPAVLRLSAWGARQLAACDYRTALQINWLPHHNEANLNAALDARRQSDPARRIVNAPVPPLPARLWEQLVRASGVPAEMRWSSLTRAARHQLFQGLTRCSLPVVGKSLNKDEFVTCGGVPLREVNFKTMESRLTPGLFFAGELLDIDGLTGGFNFQAAWTTGWVAAEGMGG